MNTLLIAVRVKEKYPEDADVQALLKRVVDLDTCLRAYRHAVNTARRQLDQVNGPGGVSAEMAEVFE